ncbi:hypothetical protein [Streptomyces antimicrobicus]|uniref:Uncharacterized protein n=1 Tax=Streptomyces antimicrobicus TaxID=2883108 RepID=A0ABS8B7G7_9ACTN|nr:hypothetical protein [Streptomyces antimicrobicus]MCB5180518.1 hypothetical protein [Streptomyces antimicrobicus]
MHSHDPSRAPSFHSPTPIYDALYSEYLRSFRALPGDRTGEEDLGFTAFGSYGPGSGGASGSGAGSLVGAGSAAGGYPTFSSVSGWNGSAWQTDPWQTVHAPAQQPQPLYAAAASGSGTYGNGRQHQTGMHHIPAALPPAPRRGY